MTVETPEMRDARNLSPDTDRPQIKAAGEGAVTAPDAFSDLTLPGVSQEDWEATVAGRVPGAGKASGQAADLIARAKQFVGTPYKWGGTSPLGFDCSGFTQYVYKALGIDLPRVSYQQAKYGKRISIDQLRPGDMVAWDTSSRNNGADHIAIYIGNGQVIHAPKPGDRVKISSLWNTQAAWGIQMNL